MRGVETPAISRKSRLLLLLRRANRAYWRRYGFLLAEQSFKLLWTA
ncbi:hypothetical protein HMPREF0972_00194 [Actinomyces sp. oral taxon 848 str. F0332]|nr:hypothetical protein HMPREF0972_00194 [Actinomyces sp. oral taxon 848 str. F0332]